MIKRSYFVRGTYTEIGSSGNFWRVWNHVSFLPQHGNVINDILEHLKGEGKSDIDVKEFYCV